MANTKVVGSNTPKRDFPNSYGDFNYRTLPADAFSFYLDDWSISEKEADVMKQGVGLFPTYWYPQNYLRVLGFAGKTNYHFYRVTGILSR